MDVCGGPLALCSWAVTNGLRTRLSTFAHCSIRAWPQRIVNQKKKRRVKNQRGRDLSRSVEAISQSTSAEKLGVELLGSDRGNLAVAPSKNGWCERPCLKLLDGSRFSAVGMGGGGFQFKISLRGDLMSCCNLPSGSDTVNPKQLKKEYVLVVQPRRA